MNTAIYQLQVALRSMGHDPGKPDGFYGPDTNAAVEGLALFGPRNTSVYAKTTLRKALRGLGWLTAPEAGEYDTDARDALIALLTHGGYPKAEAIIGGDDSILTPTKPLLRPIDHDNVIRQGRAGYVIDTIMLHCLAVPGDWHSDKSNMEIVEAVRDMHLRRGWRDIGYHAVDCPDGTIMPGRPIDQIGAGAVGYNRGVYHMVMVEVATITETRMATDYFTDATIKAAKHRIEWICQRTQIKRLAGHREVANKLCPGFEVVDADWTDRAVA